jgi:hypothetical protein
MFLPQLGGERYCHLTFHTPFDKTKRRIMYRLRADEASLE